MFSKDLMTKKQMIHAVLVGIGVGLVGVGCFIFLLMTANNPADAPNVNEQMTEVNGPAQNTTSFYAVQHGAFTTRESAESFISTYPSLNKALVIQVEEQFYVWSALANDKMTVDMEPPAFMKQMYLESVACEQGQISTIPKLLQDEKALKLNSELQENDDLPKEWISTMSAIAALSEDSNVLRLHSFAYFYEKEACLRVQFDL